MSNLVELIADANTAAQIVMPSKREQQFNFTAEGSLAMSAVWGLASAIASHMRGDKGSEVFVTKMEERVAFVRDFTTDVQLADIVKEAALGVNARREEGELREIITALGGDSVDADEKKFFEELDRNEFQNRLATHVEAALLHGSDVSVATEGWAVRKIVGFIERQYLRLSDFSTSSNKFKVAWSRAHGADIRKAARATKTPIANATIDYVEKLIGSIEAILNSAEAVQDSIEAKIEMEAELATYESHPDRQFA